MDTNEGGVARPRPLAVSDRSVRVDRSRHLQPLLSDVANFMHGMLATCATIMS